MINKANFVYSKAAAARILGVPVWAIARFEIWAYVCFVQVRGQRPTFIGKKAFRQHFVDWRIEQSKSLCVAQVNREHYRVVNPKKNSAYSVWLHEDSLECECHDYSNQIVMFQGRACCKHAYAVLCWLGHSRLSDYITAHARAA